MTLFNSDDVGLWRQRLSTEMRPGPALFLDRDGVLVEEINYLHRFEVMRIIPGAPAAVRAANETGMPVIVVTNQSGVGRGYYDWTAFAALQDALIAAFAVEAAHFDMVLACAYHADGQPPFAVADHPWRKPEPGMLRAAAETLSLDPSRAWIVGDTASDIAAGRNAGLAGGVHVLTGHGPRERDAACALAASEFDVQTAADLAAAVPLITSCNG